MRYSKQTLDYFYRMDHRGEMVAPSIDSGLVYNANKTEVIRIMLAIENANVKTARFLAQASVATVAICAFVCEWLETRPVADIKTLTINQLLIELDLPKLKSHAAALVLQALK